MSLHPVDALVPISLLRIASTDVRTYTPRTVITAPNAHLNNDNPIIMAWEQELYRVLHEHPEIGMAHARDHVNAFNCTCGCVITFVCAWLMRVSMSG